MPWHYIMFFFAVIVKIPSMKLSELIVHFIAHGNIFAVNLGIIYVADFFENA